MPSGEIVQVRGLVTSFGKKMVLNGVNMSVRRGEIAAIVGGSGSGKSTLLRQIVMLLRPTAGTIRVLDTDVTGISENDALPLRRRMGVMFQNGALFGGLTVLENVSMPLLEHTALSPQLVEKTAQLKIALAGLDASAGALYPSQLSGGMRKRAAVARAIALDPELLFLDEPSSGLDPVSADAMDELVLQLKSLLGLTIVMVTHDMDSLWRVADRVVLLADAKVVQEGTMEELAASAHPVAKQFFEGRRGRASRQAAGSRA